MPHKHTHHGAAPQHAPRAGVVPAPHPVVAHLGDAQQLPPIRPRLLTIGAPRLHVPGASVRHVPTLVAGYDQALRLLAVTRPAQPTLILLDLDATEPEFPELAAPQLAAVLAQAMHRGDIHPAWLLGLAAGPAEDADAEAYLAGCHLVLHLPLRDTMLTGLHRLAGQPATLPPTDRATRAYQRAAERVLRAVQAAQLPRWTAEDVAILLGALTRYPVEPPLRGVGRVLRAGGGVQAARQRLHRIAVSWRERFPLHAEILALLLNGFERREIVRSIVNRHLYEDSRVYAGLKALPERIAEELRIMQGHVEEGETS